MIWPALFAPGTGLLDQVRSLSFVEFYQRLPTHLQHTLPWDSPSQAQAVLDSVQSQLQNHHLLTQTVNDIVPLRHSFKRKM